MAFVDDANDRPAQQKFLDLSSLKPQSKEEVQSALHKLPEIKLRPERMPEEEDVVRPESWRHLKECPFLNPVPGSMLHVDIRELSKVDIDWKMLTLERPETPLEVHIFTRIVYLNKVTLRCIAREKVRRERAQSIRLRTIGRLRVEADAEKLEEFTYEFFSRHYGAADRGQAMEEVPRPPPPPQEPRPPTDDAVPTPDDALNAPALFPPKRRRKKIRRRRKSKKRKVKPGKRTGGGPKPLKPRVRRAKPRRRKIGSGRTLVQVVKSQEKAASKKRDEESEPAT